MAEECILSLLTVNLV